MDGISLSGSRHFDALIIMTDLLRYSILGEMAAFTPQDRSSGIHGWRRVLIRIRRRESASGQSDRRATKCDHSRSQPFGCRPESRRSRRVAMPWEQHHGDILAIRG